MQKRLYLYYLTVLGLLGFGCLTQQPSPNDRLDEKLVLSGISAFFNEADLAVCLREPNGSSPVVTQKRPALRKAGRFLIAVRQNI